MTRYRRMILPYGMLAALAACQGPPGDAPAPDTKGRKAVAEVEPLGPDFRPAAGQTLYVPAYSSILISNQGHPFDLAVTLSVRNTDPSHAILLTAAQYYDRDGELLRDYVNKPLRIGPRASTEYFVGERDRRGGVAVSFFVEWVSAEPVTNPVVEAVMVGTANNQGVSFTCPGRVLSDRRSRSEDAAAGR